MALNWTYRGNTAATRSGAVHTANSSISIGDDDSNRQVVVVMAGAGIRTLSSMTIAGVSATIKDSITNDGVVAVAYADVPTGTTALVVATMSDTDFFDVGFHVYTCDKRYINWDNSTSAKTALTSANSINLDITGYSGGLIFGGIGFGNNSDKSPRTPPANYTWRQLSEYCWAIDRLDTPSGSQNVAFSWTGNYNPAMLLVAVEIGAPPEGDFPTVISRTTDRVTVATEDPVTITLPAHQAGDLIQIALSVNGNTIATATTGSTSGWTISRANNGTDVTGFLIRKIAESDSETLVLAFEAA